MDVHGPSFPSTEYSILIFMSLSFHFYSSSSVVNKTPLGHETLRTRVKMLFCDGHLVSDKDVLTVCRDKGARWVDAAGSINAWMGFGTGICRGLADVPSC